MSTSRKKPKWDLRKYYTVFWEIGLIVVLLIFIVAMKVDLTGGESNLDLTDEQETVDMKEVVQTQQKKKPPPPPEPQVPVEVPNDEVVDQDININSELDLDEPLPEPPQQTSEGEQEERIFMAVEQNPELKIGYGELQAKAEYGPKCRRAGLEGRVTVQFVVNEQGVPTNLEVIRGVGSDCDEEAKKVIREHARFTPGRQRGNAVKVQMSLSILFRLQ